MLKKLQLEVPLHRVRDAFLYRMVTEYRLQPNILEANIGPDRSGSLIVTVEGTLQDLERGILFLRENDIVVNETD